MNNFPAFPPVVYHATLLLHLDSIRKRILIDHEDANPFADFGKGFYTTTNLEQANERAWQLQELARDPHSAILQRKHRGIVIAFDFLSHRLYTIPNEQYRFFSAPDRDWAEFVANNRVEQTPPFRHDCLWTYGPMADGRTTALCQDYFYGAIDADMLLDGFTDGSGRSIRGIRPYHPGYDQLVFHCETLANSVLIQARIAQYAVHPKLHSKARR